MGTYPQNSIVSVIASSASWIEGEAIRQLEQTASWPGMVRVVGMPDIHPGKGSPIGAAFFSQGIIYPSLVGNDIGCGMGFWQTELDARKVRLARIEKALENFEKDRSGDITKWLSDWKLCECGHENSLGTIGGGNHFAELQKIEEILRPDLFEASGLRDDRVFLLAHSGSRGLGEEILREHTSKHGSKGLKSGEEGFSSYLQRHDYAVRWAEANRARIASRALDLLDADGTRVTDVCHNHVVPIGSDDQWLHRKGATPAQDSLIVIPGSRGDLSYLVRTKSDGSEHGYSLPHGAGRKWKRSDCRERLEKRFSVESLRKTALGSKVICSDKELLFEEAPQAYKKIGQVISDMTTPGYLEVIATLRPVVTFKKGA